MPCDAFAPQRPCGLDVRSGSYTVQAVCLIEKLRGLAMKSLSEHPSDGHVRKRLFLIRAVARAMVVLRDAWCVVGLCLVLWFALNGVTGWWLARPANLGEQLLSSSAYRKATRGVMPSSRDDFIRDVAATHDSPYQGTRLVWEPYVYWRNPPYQGKTIQVDARGIRRTVQPPSRNRETPPIRIACFGGSTMWGTGVPDRQTIPSHLAQEIRDFDRPVEVTNLGQAGYVSTQEFLALATRLRDFEPPEMVVFYDGFNDVGAGLSVGAGRAANELEMEANWQLLHHPRLERLLLRYIANTPVAIWFRPTANEARRQRIERRLATTDFQKLAQQIAETYVGNLRCAAALCKNYGVRPLFILQPVIHTKRSLSAEEAAFIREHGSATKLYRLAYQQMRQTFASSELPWVDLSGAFDDQQWQQQTVFFDACHVTGTGNAWIAAQIAPIVRAALSESLSESLSEK